MSEEVVAIAPACRRFIVACLKSDPTITAAVGTRIYRDAAPLKDESGTAPAYPFITFAWMGPGGPSLYSGGVRLTAQARYAVTLWGATQAQEEAVLPAIGSALAGQSGEALGLAFSKVRVEGELPGTDALPTGDQVRREGLAFLFFAQGAD